MGRFKNALCLRAIPEDHRSCGLSVRYRRCQRKTGHKPPHRSWALEWNEGDKESKWRKERAR